MRKVVRLTESDLIKLVKRVINENQQANSSHTSFEAYKKGITDLITSNGFTILAGYDPGTYEKNLGERGIAYFIVSQDESSPYVLFYIRNPASDIIKSLRLQPEGRRTTRQRSYKEAPGMYTDYEGIMNRGYIYYKTEPFIYKTLEDTPAYKQITQTILPIIK